MAAGRWTRIAIPVLLILACGSPQERLAEHLRRATQYYEGEQWSEARIEFWNALKLDPDDAEAHFKLAETLVRLREFSDVIRLAAGPCFLDPAAVDRALSAPDDPRNANLLGRTLTLGYLAEASARCPTRQQERTSA